MKTRSPMHALNAFISALALLTFSLPASADLAEIKARGELRHLGIRYANFVTGAGDGFDVELAKGFANHIGVKYTLVYSDFYNVLRDLLGKDVVRKGSDVELTGEFPVKGDMIATGFTMLPWREKVVLYSEPTFPSQVLLVTKAAANYTPVKESGSLKQDITATKQMIGSKSLLVMEKPASTPPTTISRGRASTCARTPRAAISTKWCRPCWKATPNSRCSTCLPPCLTCRNGPATSRCSARYRTSRNSPPRSPCLRRNCATPSIPT
jgi:hypothetical protein